MVCREKTGKRPEEAETGYAEVNKKGQAGTRVKKGNAGIVQVIGILWIGLVFLAGCKIVPPEQERREVEFVVVSEDCLPKELAVLIESRKDEVIKLTYMDEGKRYIVIGYGKQKTGGYSIYVKDFYATENALYVDTCLMGPKEKNIKKEVPSYPFLVLRTEELGLPVVFK